MADKNKVRKIYQEFVSCNIIGVTLEHNGFQGGDAGHGGFVSITIENLASTSMEVNGEEVEKFNLTVRGDTERDTLLDALKMIVKDLETFTTLTTESGRVIDKSLPLDTPIEDPLVKISVRCYNSLKAEGIMNVDDLIHCSRHDLLLMRGMGKKSVDEVEEMLASYGLQLASENEARLYAITFKKTREYEDGEYLYYRGDIQVKVISAEYYKRRWVYLIEQDPHVYDANVDEWTNWRCETKANRLSRDKRED